MPQVPYQEYPTAVPTERGPSGLNINASPAAFGENIAQAIKGVGGNLDQVGNELFTRAQALQELQNSAESDDAVTKYMAGLGETHAKFNALEGEARVKAYPQYLSDIKNLREQIGNGVSNPMARRMYDRESLSTMGRTMFSGAGLAADAQKQWFIGSAQSSIDMSTKRIVDNPDDDGIFQDRIKDITDKVQHISQIKGEDAVQAQDRLVNTLSSQYRERVISVGHLEPNKAATMLDDYKTRGLITQPDFEKADTVVRTASRAIGSANIAHDVYSNNPDMGIEDMVTIARDRAASSPFAKDPIFEKDTVNALRGLWNQRSYEQRIEKAENWETVSGAILDGVQKGTVRTTRDLLLDPKVASAYHNLPPQEQIRALGLINSTTASLNKVTNQDNFIRLNGMLGSPEGVESFLNTDLTKEPLAYPDLKALQNKQNTLMKDQTADPRVLHAMSMLRGSIGSQLQALGIYSRDKNNPDDYDHFTGALSEALTNWRDTHKIQPTADDIINKIAPNLLRTHTVPGWITNSQVPFYNTEVPDEVKQKLTQQGMEQTGQPPIDQEIQRAYIREQWKNLYGSKKDQTRAGQ
jgi:hypothetical protein